MPSATIQKIIALDQIEGADRILLASVLGWKCVVSKSDNFRLGDLVIFIEIDSVVPEKPEFEFLRKANFRVKTMKLRGQVSQGLVLPIVPHLDPSGLVEGVDVSEALGVIHYEKPIPIHMKDMIAGSFPTHLVPKTDEVRIQSAPGLLEEIKGLPIYITTKVDGTSATYILHDNKFYICSRNNIIKDTEENKDNLYVAMAYKYDIEAGLRHIERKTLGRNLAIQGEIAGPGIQGNPMGLKEVQLFVFNIYDVGRRTYLGIDDLKFATEMMNLQTVPVVSVDIILVDNITLDKLLEMSTGTYNSTNKPREGIVIRPMVETYSQELKGRLSFKVINPEYEEI